jgi:PAS domain S-box-containing protein
MSRPLKVVIIEDSPDDTELLVRELMASGFEPEHERVEEAGPLIAALARHSWDLVISDWSMPRLRGRDALAIVRAAQPDLPFIIVSGTVGEHNAVEAMRAGAQDYVLKGNLSRLPPAVERELRESEVRASHRRAQRALRENEARYRVLFENSPLPKWLFDVETLRFLEVNDSAVRNYGYSREEFLQMSIKDIRPPGDVAAVVREVGIVALGPRSFGLWKHKKKDGTLIDVEVTGHTFPLEGRVARLIVAQDITERRAAEAQARLLHTITRAAGEAGDLGETLEAVLRLVCEATGIPLANAWVPGRAGKLECRGHWARPEDRERFRPLAEGVSFENGVGLPERAWASKQPVWIANLAEDASVQRAAVAAELGLRAAVAVPILVGEELVAVIEAFLPQPGEEGRKLIALLSAVGDQIGSVVRRRRAEEALSRSEARFTRLSESGIIGILVLDVAGRMLEANDTFLKMVGVTRDELQPGVLRVQDITAPESSGAGEAAFEQVRKQGAVGLFEKVYLRRDGSRVPVLVGAAMLDEKKIISFILDVTERKQLEQMSRQAFELDLQNRRILEATRLKSAFLANMSHELRTPLNAILGFGELLYDDAGPRDPAQHHEFLGNIVKSGRYLLQLINDVLDLAKVEAGKLDFRPEPIHLELVIAEVTSVVRAISVAKNISIDASVDPELKKGIFLDPVRLKQILYNYVSNALKFTPAGGAVIVRARPHGETMLVLEVEDTGPGIAPGEIERLFIEFQRLEARTARETSGTGLGLALTRRLAEAQGGSVGVRSALGKGSVFYVVLPRRNPPPRLR